MKNTNILNLFREKNIVLPLLLLKNYKKFNLELNEFIFLIYLYNLGDKTVFNPNQFSNDLNIDLPEVMSLIGILTDKNLIKVEVLKNDKGLMEEVILLDDFYNKITYVLIEEYNQGDNEIIKSWLENGYTEELVKEAVREAVFNGVSNLKYMDKILYEWEKAGIKTVNDVEERRKKFQKNKEKENDVDIDIVDWDWFESEE